MRPKKTTQVSLENIEKVQKMKNAPKVSFLNLFNFLKGGGGGAATAVVEAVLVLILIAMSCLAVYLGWRHYKTRCTMEPDCHFYRRHHF